MEPTTKSYANESSASCKLTTLARINASISCQPWSVPATKPKVWTREILIWLTSLKLGQHAGTQELIHYRETAPPEWHALCTAEAGPAEEDKDVVQTRPSSTKCTCLSIWDEAHRNEVQLRARHCEGDAKNYTQFSLEGASNFNRGGVYSIYRKL